MDATANSSGASGKRIDTGQVTTSEGNVHRQRITIGDPIAPENFATLAANGDLNVANDSTQLFGDTFDSTLDTTNRWNTPVSAGGGVAAANANGNLTLGTGTTANGYSYLTSQASFVYLSPALLERTSIIQVEASYIANTYRFWGVGTAAATPTAAAPLVNAIGFELYTDGKMYAVLYINSTRTVIQDLSTATGNGTQPADGAFHRYGILIRSSHNYWTIDNTSIADATSNFQVPYVQTLPAILLAAASTSAPGSSGIITSMVESVGDTGRNNIQISDGVYEWRKATVDLYNNLRVATGFPKTAQLTQAPINVSASGANILVAASGSTTVRVYRIFFVNSNVTSSTTITVQDTTPTSFSGAFLLNSGGAFSADSDTGEPMWISAAGKGFQLNSSTAVQLSGTVWYTQS